MRRRVGGQQHQGLGPVVRLACTSHKKVVLKRPSAGRGASGGARGPRPSSPSITGDEAGSGAGPVPGLRRATLAPGSRQETAPLRPERARERVGEGSEVLLLHSTEPRPAPGSPSGSGSDTVPSRVILGRLPGTVAARARCPARRLRVLQKRNNASSLRTLATG